MTESTRRCPACGATAPAAHYCNACGAPLGPHPCAVCGTEVRAGARFCSQCGASAASGEAAPRITASRRPLWGVAGAGAALLTLVLVVLLRKDGGRIAAPAEVEAPSDAGLPPDISAMTPRERFDRLYNRIMQATESGDEATATRFTPMALMAYAQLPDADADARYHAALIKVHSGDADGALALADTILARTPGHLFGYVVRGTVARWRKDPKALAAAYAAFLGRYDVEMKANRPEYSEHARALDEFRQAARGAAPAAGK